MKHIWTDEHDAYLRSAWGKESASAIMLKIGCNKNALYDRLHFLGILVGDARLKQSARHKAGRHTDVMPIADPLDIEAIRAADNAFVAAMKAAIKSGEESAREGVVSEPCTSRSLPLRFYPQVTVVSRSVAADCAEFTGDYTEI